MRQLNKLLREITQLTDNLETNYPELYKFLDETPFTIPAENHPKIDKKVLLNYLESLRELLKHHLETHPAPPLSSSDSK